MKRFLSVTLSFLMLVTMLPFFAASALADTDPDLAGPNDSDHAYLDLHANGEDYSFYFMGSLGDAKVDGVSYDLDTNTLTLDNYNEPGTIIEASEMGSNFTISVAGENHIKAITVLADKYMGSLSIVGDGAITMNENKEYDGVPLYLDANNTASGLVVMDSVKLSVHVNGSETAVKVLNSLKEDPILCADAEYRISSYEESSTGKKWITANDTQRNTFFKVKDSDKYTTFCYDEYLGDNALYEFVLVNRRIDDEDVMIAKQTMDEMGNPIIIQEDAIELGETVMACQIMSSSDKAVVEKADDETEYVLTEYTVGGEGPFWDVHKVLHDEELGNFFYPVSIELTEKPVEYLYIYETVREAYQYIEYSFANFEETDDKPVEQPCEHNYKTTIIKATSSKDGKIVKACTNAGCIETKTTIIPKIAGVTLSAVKYTYDGKVKKPAVTVKNRKGNRIAASQYTVAYANNTKVGKASVKITFKGNYSGTVTKTFKIIPKAAAIKSLTPGTRKLTVRMTTKPSGKGAAAYQISYKQKGTGSWKKTTTTAQSKLIKSLKKGKKYYVKVRAYKKVGNTTYYGAWSKTILSKKIK